MAIDDLKELVVLFNGPTKVCEMTFGFVAKTSGADVATLASGFKTNLVKNTSGGLLIRKLASVNVSEIDVVDVVPGTAATYVYTFAAVPGDGTAGEGLPPQCAGLFSWRTNLRGRSYRGRTYWPFMLEADQNAGTWVSSVLTPAAAIVTNLLAVYGPTGTDPDWQFCVISRQHNGVVRPTPAFTNVVSGAFRTEVATQRRRVPR